MASVKKKALYKPMFYVKGADSADIQTLRLLALRPTGQLFIFLTKPCK
jgi:hypothetical protein